jgi:ferredoxin
MMDAVQKQSTLESFLAQQDEESWSEALTLLLPLVHPVDQDATRIWFAFWPLQLHQIVQESYDVERTARELELKGVYGLEERLDTSLEFLFGSQYWSEVHEAVCAHIESSASGGGSLADRIQVIAKEVASSLQVPESHLIGITSVALMVLQQIGKDAFSAYSPKTLRRKSSPEQVLRARSRKRGGLLGFLRTVNARYAVTFNEQDKSASFQAIHGQDISMAAGKDERDFQSIDPRRTEGPIPFQCRVGTCGTCWIGVLSGKEKLSEISTFERERLEYFGYDFGRSEQETHPPIRLACQAKCFGDVSIAISPWNGVLNVRRFQKT